MFGRIPGRQLQRLGQHATQNFLRQARECEVEELNDAHHEVIELVSGELKELVVTLYPTDASHAGLHLRELQRQLLGRGLSIKTARNAIDGSFRAAVRDARRDDLLASDPFAALDWPRALAVGKPDPFVELERDQLLEWFRRKRPAYFPFIFTLFHAGARPSEMAAVRWGDVDVRRGTLTIARSRYLGVEGSPKTRGSARTITLLPAVCAVLRELMPLRADTEAYVFTTAKTGNPINHSEWAKTHWHVALRATALRPRKFYATRHTFISVALSRGVNLKWLADFCGTSVAMIEKHYGRFLPDGDAAQLRLLAGGPSLSDHPPVPDLDDGQKTETPAKVSV